LEEDKIRHLCRTSLKTLGFLKKTECLFSLYTSRGDTMLATNRIQKGNILSCQASSNDVLKKWSDICLRRNEILNQCIIRHILS